jgi:hypothetical protein
MKKWTDYVAMERVLNYFVGRHEDERIKYADEVYEILVKAYAKSGGIHGNGFRDAQDMVKNIPFWKLVRKSDKIVAVVMYKDRDGRKMVAAGSDGSEEGKDMLGAILMQDLAPPDKNRFEKGSRAYFEISDKALSFLVSITGYELLESLAVSIPEVKRIMKDDVILDLSMADPKDQNEERHPRLKKWFYVREIGGHNHVKILIGVTGNPVS